MPDQSPRAVRSAKTPRQCLCPIASAFQTACKNTLTPYAIKSLLHLLPRARLYQPRRPLYAIRHVSPSRRRARTSRLPTSHCGAAGFSVFSMMAKSGLAAIPHKIESRACVRRRIRERDDERLDRFFDEWDNPGQVHHRPARSRRDLRVNFQECLMSSQVRGDCNSTLSRSSHGAPSGASGERDTRNGKYYNTDNELRVTVARNVPPSAPSQRNDKRAAKPEVTFIVAPRTREI